MKRVESEWRNEWGTARPYTRHETGDNGCEHQGESDYNKCSCPKWIYEYRKGGKPSRRSLNTPSWGEALDKARSILRSFDPVIRAAEQLTEQKSVTIEQAVFSYVDDMRTRLNDSKTLVNVRATLGNIERDPEGKLKMIRPGRLFTWLATLGSKRPTYIREITADHLSAWRSTWTTYESDLTKAQRWSMVSAFLGFAEKNEWTTSNPARKLKPPKVKKGNRTAIFTDEEYERILAAISLYEPDNLQKQTREVWHERLTTFIELMRWSGMAIADAVQYGPGKVHSDGVLRYHRQKTDELAVVPLPDSLLVMLRNVSLEPDSVGSSQPFRSRGLDMESDTKKWRRRIAHVFELAGITKVQTENGQEKEPHPHMLRDTFAVWHLRNGASLKTVSKMLGHSKTTTTERSYLPWVKELEDAHIADARKALTKFKMTTAKAKVVSISSR